MPPEAKVILVGDSGVGKTCIAGFATHGSFQHGSQPTVGAGIFHLNVNTPSEGPISLNIWDTAGQERYENFVPMYARDASGAVVVFDITRAESYEHLEKWFELIRADTANCEIVLVGNKADLAAERVVDFDTAQAFAEDHHIDYVESSAKTGQGVSAIFDRLGELILKFPKQQAEIGGRVEVETVPPPVIRLEERQQPAGEAGLFGALGGLLKSLPCSI
jgi:small GTP-binding protein